MLADPSLSTISVLIADDEPIACRILQRLLSKREEISVVGCCTNGKQTADAILKLQPQIVFLDIQMPEMDGFEVLRSIPAGKLPCIVFVTAYDRYAIKAFEFEAVDYLLKPFDEERFLNALNRVEQRIQLQKERNFHHQLAALLAAHKIRPQDVEKKEAFLEDRLPIKEAGRIYFIRIREINWIEACDNYVLIHTHGETHMSRESMKQLENKLDPQQFFRAHRSCFMNLRQIREINTRKFGGSVVTLQDGSKVTVSRSRQPALNAALKSL